jgi:hypothetical protein
MWFRNKRRHYKVSSVDTFGCMCEDNNTQHVGCNMIRTRKIVDHLEATGFTLLSTRLGGGCALRKYVNDTRHIIVMIDHECGR